MNGQGGIGFWVLEHEAINMVAKVVIVRTAMIRNGTGEGYPSAILSTGKWEAHQILKYTVLKTSRDVVLFAMIYLIRGHTKEYLLKLVREIRTRQGWEE